MPLAMGGATSTFLSDEMSTILYPAEGAATPSTLSISHRNESSSIPLVDRSNAATSFTRDGSSENLSSPTERLEITNATH